MKTSKSGAVVEPHPLIGWCWAWAILILPPAAMGGLFTVSSLSRGALQLQFAVGLALLLLAFGIFVFWWRLALRRDFSNRHWWRGFWLLLAGGVSQMIVYLPLTAFLYAGCWIMWTRQGVKEFFD